jgi:hypothetical protein
MSLHSRSVLDSIDDFIRECVRHSGAFSHGTVPRTFPTEGDLYCPKCGGPRRMRVLVRWPVREASPIPVAQNSVNLVDTSTDAIAEQLTPMAFTLVCVQCSTIFTALLFRGPEKFEIAVFPSVRGGLSTPHTGAGVAYYLDQAQRSESAGAFSAAMGMYRSALEHLLFEQGYTMKMLGPKITALETALAAGSAPRWARDLDPQFLKVLNRLANAALHPGDGDVSRQEALDSALIQSVKVTFAELLLLVYEREHATRDRLQELESALAEIEGHTSATEPPLDTEATST